MTVGGSQRTRREANHHQLPVHEVVLLLETDATRGLSNAEAARRLHQFGPNLLPRVKRRGAPARFLLQFHHPLVYVLLVSMVATIVLGEMVDAAVIAGVVVVNAVVGFVQESRAERALESLVAMVETMTHVVREGERIRVRSRDVVPGDLVVLEAGDKVPADLRLVTARDLEIDESLLTGESVPVAKSPLEVAASAPLADRRNMAYAGTVVSAGLGTGVVVATGSDTEVGRIHRLLGQTETVATPLTRKIGRFSRVLTIAILALAAVTFFLGVARGEAVGEMVTASVALAVAAIPEGLPAVVTITLAVGVARMARRNAVIRKLPAVETLGSTTVICADKTGTLTTGQMTVVRVVAGGLTFDVEGAGYDPDGSILLGGVPVSPADHPPLDECLRAGLLCSDTRVVASGRTWTVIGDPTEAALVVVARKAGLRDDEVKAAFPRVDVLPFASERQYMATAHLTASGKATVVYVKGSPERILAMCADELKEDGTRGPLDLDRVSSVAADLAAHGLRVLAFAQAASADRPALSEEDLCGALTFLGLQAMRDPPRPDAVAAVRKCHEAGIAVKMVTGDHAATAAAIAREMGILDEHGPPGVVTGTELAGLDGERLEAVAARAAVFARVGPEQKLDLVNALQRRGHVVAMTGDGVNDAPALKRADIGVAMGSGTEVAKEAADMVLTDDNFASIEAAIEEGRTVFDNLTKFIVWALPTSFGEGLVILAAIVSGTVLPILPLQVLWVNMTTAVVLGLPLAFEPAETGIMRRPPRDPGRPLLTPPLAWRILLVVAVMVAGAFTLFDWERRHGATVAEARTAAVNVFVMIELAYLFNARRLEGSAWRAGPFANRWVWIGSGLMVGLQVAFTYLPALNGVFDTAPVVGGAWARVALFALGVHALVGVDKRVLGRLGRRGS